VLRTVFVFLLCLAAVGAARGQDSPPSEILGTGWQWVTAGSNVTQITTGARVTWLNNWYGQADIGGYSATDDFEANFFLGANGGRRLALHRRVHLAVELGYRHIMPDDTDDPAVNTDRHFSLSARLKLELTLNRHFGAFIGTGIDRLYRGYSLGSAHRDTGLFFWGVSLL